MEKEQFLEQVESICNLKVKGITHGPNTKVVTSPEVVYFRPGGGRVLEVSEEGLESLEKFTGMPGAFEKKLEPRTFNTVATELLSKKGSYSVITKDNVVTGFTPLQDFRYIDPEKVAMTLYKAVPQGQIEKVMMPRPFTVAVDVVGAKESNVTRGDIVLAGASISFSPINSQEPEVSAFVKRLACLNGATTTDAFQKFTFGGGGGGGGDGPSFWSWLGKSVRTATGSVDRIVARWRLMVGDRIPEGQRAAALTALLDQARIRDDVAEAVRAEAMERPPESAYDLMNLITWASSHIMTDPRRIIHARAVADEYSREHEHKASCPMCHRNAGSLALPAPAEVTEAG